MRLEQLDTVNRIDIKRRQLIKCMEAVEADKLQLFVEGEIQDDAMIAVIRPVILMELRGRKAELERELAGFDVQVG